MNVSVTPIDRRSGRGKEQHEAAEQQQTQQAMILEEQRLAMRGPKVTLEFDSEYQQRMWQQGFVVEGKQLLAEHLMGKLRRQSMDSYRQLVVKLGTLLNAPGGENPVAVENTLRQFLGLPDAEPGAARDAERTDPPPAEGGSPE